MAYVFSGIVAINPDTNLPELNGAGQVFARTDESWTTPLTVEDLNGNPMDTITTSPLGLVTPFRTTTHPQVWWVSGGVGILLTSLDGLLADAETARLAAINAAAQAQQAAADLAAYITTYPGSGYVVNDTQVAALVSNEASATHAAIISVAGEAGGGDAQAANLYAFRKRTLGGTGPWEPANRGSYAGIVWVGIDPSSSEQQPGDLRFVPVSE